MGNLLLAKKRSSMVFAISVVIGYFVSTCVALALSKIKYSVYIVQCVQPLLFIIISVVFANKYGDGVKNTLFIKKFNPKYLLYAIATFVGLFFGIGYINQTIFYGADVGIDITISNWGDYLLYVLSLSIMPSLGEELLFRGVALFSLLAYVDRQDKNGFGIKNDILISLLIGVSFALFHKSVYQLIYQFFYGVALTLIVIRSGSIIPAIIMHLLNNLLILTVYFINPLLNLHNLPLCIIGVVVFLLAFFMLTFSGSKNKNVKIDYECVLPYFVLCCAFSLTMLLLFI